MPDRQLLTVSSSSVSSGSVWSMRLTEVRCMAPRCLSGGGDLSSLRRVRWFSGVTWVGSTTVRVLICAPLAWGLPCALASARLPRAGLPSTTTAGWPRVSGSTLIDSSSTWPGRRGEGTLPAVRGGRDGAAHGGPHHADRKPLPPPVPGEHIRAAGHRSGLHPAGLQGAKGGEVAGAPTGGGKGHRQQEGGDLESMH
eukprot:605383-Hanusia_phi.AAC.3